MSTINDAFFVNIAVFYLLCDVLYIPYTVFYSIFFNPSNVTMSLNLHISGCIIQTNKTNTKIKRRLLL